MTLVVLKMGIFHKTISAKIIFVTNQGKLANILGRTATCSKQVKWEGEN